MPIRVLFLCVHNSARSQMAEGMLRAWGGDVYEAHSAGNEATEVRPMAIQAMAERGIDISQQHSKTTADYDGQTFDYAITVCDDAKEACPYFPRAAHQVHWRFDDPSAASGTDEERLAEFRRVRDEIGAAVREFIGETSTQQMRDHEAKPALELYMLRHADAGDPTAWKGDDDLRPLSEKGEKQAASLGKFLAKRGFEVDAILSSPKVRAKRTAEVVGEAVHVKVKIDERLGSVDGLDALDHIVAAAGARRVMVVGHDPDFSELAAELAGVTRLPLKKGALARIDTSLPLRAGRGTLRWLVPPDLLG